MMDNIQIFYTLQGQIIGERVDNGYLYTAGLPIKLKNPALLVQNGPTNVQFVPLDSFVEDDTFELAPSALLFAAGAKPKLPILNKYQEIFGGIQIYDASVLTK